MLQNTLKKIFGSRSDREIKRLLPLVEKVNQFSGTLKNKTDEDLKNRTNEMKEEISSAIEKKLDELNERKIDSSEIKNEKSKLTQEEEAALASGGYSKLDEDSLVSSVCRFLIYWTIQLVFPFDQMV